MMSDAATPLLRIDTPPKTLREMVLERLRAAIISGHFKSGERLVERPLCDSLGVSRTVIREAMRYLEAEGLVEIQSNRGPVVASMDWDRAAQIYEIRRLLETNAARACAEKADARVKTDLRRALKALGAAYDAGETRPLFDASTDFYQTIFLAAGHDMAWDIVQRLNSRISRLRAMTLATTDRHVSGFARMTQIAEAICANDADAAGRAVETHLSEAAAIAHRLLA